MESQHSPLADSEEVTNTPQSNLSHKRTFSTEKSLDESNDDPSANDLPPPKKRKKSESQFDSSESPTIPDTKLTADESNLSKRTFSTEKSLDEPNDDPSANESQSDSSESPTIPDTKLTADDGDDLIPLRPDEPNVFYGYSDALSDLFVYGGGWGPYGVTVGLYWLKSMVMDRLQAPGDQDDHLDGLSYAGIVCKSKNLQTLEAKLLLTHFSGLSGDWWYEVTLKRQKPEGMGMKVRLESSVFYQDGDIYGGKNLGDWWISDIQAAEGESKKAIETVHATMF